MLFYAQCIVLLCSFTHKCVFGRVEHDFCYLTKVSRNPFCLDLRAFGCKFFLRKSCLCKENNKYEVCKRARSNPYSFMCVSVRACLCVLFVCVYLCVCVHVALTCYIFLTSHMAMTLTLFIRYTCYLCVLS